MFIGLDQVARLLRDSAGLLPVLEIKASSPMGSVPLSR
jgi:hypothetical protein